MHRRMGHRHDARVVVSMKPFVEELDEKVARGETCCHALIISPTLFLDVEACIFCCFQSWPIVRETA